MAEQKGKFTQNGDVVFFDYVKDRRGGPNGASGGLSGYRDDVVFVWDIDKTYLDTQFETFRGLLKTAFEKAFQKRNVPGTASLIRALEASQGQQSKLPIYFISASPPQMEAKIHQKMKLDRIGPFGIFFKDNLKNLRPRKFKRLK